MIFCNMQTQWTTSFGGFVGLRYEVLLMQGGMFDLYNITDRRKILEELQIMEAAALKELNKEKKQMAASTSRINIEFLSKGDSDQVTRGNLWYKLVHGTGCGFTVRRRCRHDVFCGECQADVYVDVTITRDAALLHESTWRYKHCDQLEAKSREGNTGAQGMGPQSRCSACSDCNAQ